MEEQSQRRWNEKLGTQIQVHHIQHDILNSYQLTWQYETYKMAATLYITKLNE